MTTPNNQDDELDSILVKLYTSGMHEKQKEFDTYQNMTRKEKKDFRAYIHTPFLAMTQDAKAAILAWHNQQLEQAVIEARVDELNRVTGEFTTEDDQGNKISTFDRLSYLLSKSKEEK